MSAVIVQMRISTPSIPVLQGYTEIISVTLTQDDFLLKSTLLKIVRIIDPFIKPIRNFATFFPPFVDLLEADRIHEVFEMIERQVARVFDTWKR